MNCRFLREDIESHVKRGHIYGRKGDQVNIVAEHGEVMIVEATSGDRYPVRIEKLSEKPIVERSVVVPEPMKETPKLNWLPKKTEIPLKPAVAGKQAKLF
jgi:hypothetical protein